MEEILHNLALYGYAALFLYSLTGGFLGLAVASIYSATTGKMDINLIILTSFAGNFIGDNLLFIFSQKNKQILIKDYFHKFKKEIALSKLLLRKYGDKVIFIQKYIQGVRTFIPVIFGVSNYPIKKFLIFNLFASFIWSILIGSSLYFFSGYLSEYIEYIIKNPYILLSIGFIFLSINYIYLKLILRIRN